MSASASQSFTSSVKTNIKGVTVQSLKGEISLQEWKKDDVYIAITPSSRSDYKSIETLARRSGVTTIVVNGFAKDPNSIPGDATMAYFLKPLTYNSQVAGYLIREYPGLWTVLDASTRQALGSFSDEDILFGKSNTPDLRGAVRLVQKSVDERAIRARQGKDRGDKR